MTVATISAADVGEIFSLPELPTGRYQGTEFYGLEIENVWLKSWLFAGHVSELSEPSAFKLFQQVGKSVIISRGADDVIRAFHNTCRHRGSEILLEPSGVAKRFICPYHAWGYDTNGKLVSVPDIEDFPCLKKEEKSLLPVRFGIWRGLMFVNFSDEGMSLEEYLRPFEKIYADVEFERLEVRRSDQYPIVGNWKAVYDNFLESYHVGVVHRPSIGASLESINGEQHRYANGHGRMVSRLRRTSKPLMVDDKIDEQRRISPDPRFEQAIEGMQHFPNGIAVIDSISINFVNIWPDGHDKAIISTLTLGKRTEEGVDDSEFWNAYNKFQEVVLAEDRVLLPGIQRSINNGTSPTMVLKNEEALIHWYHQEIDRLIGPEKIEPALRVRGQIPPSA